jgi:aminoglycoside phosphotransferase (APT) family kinase protein
VVTEVAGIDRNSVDTWLATNVDVLTPPFTWRPLASGHSNLTYLVEGADTVSVVLRRPPLGELQPRAHDMHREFRIISGLWPTAVPVAEPLAYCGDEAVTGARFYVMGFVDGRPSPHADDLRRWLPEPETQRRAALSLIDSLAQLHVVDPEAVGLGDLGRRDDYVGRQLSSWYRSWTSSAEDADYDDPRVHEIHDLLQLRKPAPGPIRIVHGDYGFHNCLVTRDGDVAAIVDWEVCTLGDARSDVAFVLNRWSVEGAELVGREDITMPASFPSAGEVVARYGKQTGADLSDLEYFIILNHWRSACIAHGVYTRYVRGQRPAEGVDVEGFKRTVGVRLDVAASAAAALR